MFRIGLYAGAFDPVHSGHISFALQAKESAELDKIYFLPERKPRLKPNVEHYGHRVAMLKQALKPYAYFAVHEMVEARFTVSKTLPQLITSFSDDQLVFLFGSDVIPGLASWTNASKLIGDREFVVGLRSNDDRETTKRIIDNWEALPRAVTIFDSYAPSVTSQAIRTALGNRQTTAGLLKSVERYSDHNWLYVSLQSIDMT